jgi:Ca2+-binding RTX toxin-like protein
MVWLHPGGFKTFGTVIGAYSDGKFSGKIYHDAESNYTAIVADAPYTRGKLDVAAIVSDLRGRGIIKPEEYLASFELGSEVVSGSGSLTIHNLDFTVQSFDATGQLVTKSVTGAGTTTSVAAELPVVVISDDRMIYDRDALLLDGGEGQDTLLLLTGETVDLSNGSDQVNGGLGRVTGFEHVDASAAVAKVAITGSSENNLLIGSRYDDVLAGGAGDDILVGGGGTDTLFGGAGADTFRFGSIFDMKGTRDQIRDFSRSEGDKIDLRGIDAIKGGADDPFTFVGANAFTKSAGELRYSPTSGGILVQGDVDGNGKADFTIFVASVQSLAFDDFLL